MAKRNRKSESGPRAGRGPWSLALVVIVAFSATTVGLRFGHALLLERLSRLESLRFDPADLIVTPTPSWIVGDLAHRTLVRANLASEPLVLTDPTLARRLHDAFRRSPWVRSASVRIANRRVRVDLDFREPVLCIPWNGQGCYVDDEGLVLYPRDAEPSRLRRCPIVVGISPQRLPPVGERFAEPWVAEAARLARLLDRRRDRLVCEALAARPVAVEGATRPHWEVHLANGPIVRWGLVESPAAEREKLGRLLDRLDRSAKTPPLTLGMPRAASP